jgi:predicted nucleic acid-binding protein
MIRRVSVVTLTHDLLDNAATQQPDGLSTTGAIHLASALTLKKDLTAFVSYDKQLLAAAESAGLPALSPG